MSGVFALLLAAPLLAQYQILPTKDVNFKSYSKAQIGILEKLNRADAKHLPRLPALVVPEQWPGDEMSVCPLPGAMDAEAGEAKFLFADLALQAFGAYEAGKLVYWGPISSGSKRVPTPPGTYHLNWRAKRHVSTDDASWILTWYFNFHNTSGRAFHAYPMPGYPASHSCIRLLDRDAEWLYHWGVSWQLSENGREVLVPGTKVVLDGAYDFQAAPPWRMGLTLPVAAKP
jgi:lipoprotein-anchoring transpeptidase ErfK/SrfK